VTQVFWKPGYTDRIEVGFDLSVPSEVTTLLNQIIDLPLWQYQLLREELDKIVDGPALRLPTGPEGLKK